MFTELPAWRQAAADFKQDRKTTLREAFQADPGRAKAMSARITALARSGWASGVDVSFLLFILSFHDFETCENSRLID